MKLPRGAVPLLWADASSHLVQRLYREARASVRWPGGETGGESNSKQRWLRKVRDVFDRKLRDAQVYVEGLSEEW